MSFYTNPQLDDLDYQILEILIKDSRTPYLEVARLCHVSGGTIHVRMKKMEDLGIIKGTKLIINTNALGYDVCCFVGIYLDKNSAMNDVVEELRKIKQIVEVHFITGSFSIFAKIICRNITHLQELLINDLNVIDGVQRTETLISLSQPINRNIEL